METSNEIDEPLECMLRRSGRMKVVRIAPGLGDCRRSMISILQSVIDEFCGVVTTCMVDFHVSFGKRRD